MDIFALFRSFWQAHSATVISQLSAIIAGVLCAPQHITMRNIARWNTCSYRTIQRFFATPIYWPSFHTVFVTTHLHDTAHPYILAFDETTITKSGKKTYRCLQKLPGACDANCAFCSEKTESHHPQTPPWSSTGEPQ